MKRFFKDTNILNAILRYNDVFEISIPYNTSNYKGHLIFGVTKDSTEYGDKGSISYYLSFWKSKGNKYQPRGFAIMQPRYLFRLFTKKS